MHPMAALPCTAATGYRERWPGKILHMFDSIRLLCINGAHDRCYRATIVPSDKYLKIANSNYLCPRCGHVPEEIKPFFLQMLALNKAAVELDGTGLMIDSYAFAISDSHINDDLFVPDHAWDFKQSWNWNYQISRVTIIEPNSSQLLPIEEGSFINKGARISPRSNIYDFTFNNALRRNRLFIGDYELLQKQRVSLKTLLSAVHKYNKHWMALVDDLVSALPLDEEFLPDQNHTWGDPDVLFYQ
jgi:hypothetical protein